MFSRGEKHLLKHVARFGENCWVKRFLLWNPGRGRRKDVESVAGHVSSGNSTATTKI